MARTTGSDELYRLIHSLTASENGYFQKYAKRHSDKGSDYLKLFSVLHKMEKYEEAQLKRQFNNLPVLKSYLFDLIVESLYISENSPEPTQIILKGITRLRILIHRGLMNKALKLLEEYKTLAAENELYFLTAYLQKIELNFLRDSWDGIDRIIKVNTFFAHIRLAEDKQRNIDDMLRQAYIVGSLLKLKHTKEVIPVPEDWVDVDFLKSEKSALSPYAERMRLSALGTFYALKDDLLQRHQTHKRFYEFEKERWGKLKGKVKPDNYLVAINNYIVSAIEVNDYSLADKLTESLLAIPLHNQTLILKNKIRYVNLKQGILWDTGRHKEGEDFSKKMLVEIGDLNKLHSQSHRLNMYIIMGSKALFEFSNSHYKEALGTLTFFNSVSIGNSSPHDKKGAEFLTLIIQLEIGNHELINALILSIKKRITTLNRQDKAFLFAFNKYMHSTKEFFEYLKKHCSEITLLGTLDLKDWIESKPAKKPLSEIVRKNHSSV